MFSFLLTVKILQHQQAVNASEWRFLLAGPTSSDITVPNPAPAWLTDKAWVEVLNLAHLKTFQVRARGVSMAWLGGEVTGRGSMGRNW
jgi:dynein heavy chain